ncbi:unnamed protein product [Angiostrongylus costaricensis]|uniref:PDZ domain-containing protein n=1 Tax=Angiostrongylus costaricensis TaxID=334426 RepID=A0A158PHU9_ANGCS|nr:unnamed protein product [Angiostrongylus costaricensis]
MSYETISVRMSRSDSSIKWGFTLGLHGSKIIVATVDRESLSDKAGMKPGDEVDSICGRDAHNMSINEANGIVFTAHQEIRFNLRRYVTTHTCLPWTLTEKDNKLFVDEVQPGFGTGFGTGNEMWATDKIKGARTNTVHLQLITNHWTVLINKGAFQFNISPVIKATHRTSSFTRGAHNGSYVVNNSQPRVYHSPSTYSRHEQSDHTKMTTQRAAVQEEHEYTTTRLPIERAGHSHHMHPFNTYKYYLCKINTVFVYNSPMNLYTTESAAEQYTMQTGRPIESAFFQAF